MVHTAQQIVDQTVVQMVAKAGFPGATMGPGVRTLLTDFVARGKAGAMFLTVATTDTAPVVHASLRFPTTFHSLVLYILQAPPSGNNPSFPMLLFGVLHPAARDKPTSIPSSMLVSACTTLTTTMLPAVHATLSWSFSTRRAMFLAAHTALAPLIMAAHATAHQRTVVLVPSCGGDDQGGGGGADASGVQHHHQQQKDPVLVSLDPPGTAARDPVVVRWLETLVMQWTRTLQNTLHAKLQDAQQHEKTKTTESGVVGAGGGVDRGGVVGALQQLRHMTLDLKGVVDQMQSPDAQAMIRVLQHAHSPCVEPLCRAVQAVQIQAEAAEHQCTLLQMLEKECTLLYAATLQDAAAVTPSMLSTLRQIMTGQHMTTSTTTTKSSSMTATQLVQRVAQELVLFCKKHVDVKEVLQGEMGGAGCAALQASKSLLQTWLTQYTAAAAALPANTTAPNNTIIITWPSPDDPNLFAHVHAFIARCTDLQWVAQARAQFQHPAPLGGPVGPLHTCWGPALRQLECVLLRTRVVWGDALAKLAGVEYDVMDVGVLQWHHDLVVFDQQVDSLDLQLHDALIQASSNASSLTEHAALVRHAAAIATLPQLKAAVQQELDRLYAATMELLAVQRWVDTIHRNPHYASLPPLAGKALAAQRAMHHVQSTWEGVQDVLQTHPNATIIKDIHARAIETLQRTVRDAHNEWCEHMGASVLRGLTMPLLTTSRGGQQQVLLLVNMEGALQTALEEVPYFQQTGLDMPAAAGELLARRARLVNMQVKVKKLCIQYNGVASSVLPEHKTLLSGCMRTLDAAIHPGTSKLQWVTAPHQVEQFFKAATKACSDAAALIQQVHTTLHTTHNACSIISNTPLLDLTHGTAHCDAFWQHQQHCVERAHVVWQQQHGRVVGALVGLCEAFVTQTPEIRRAWRGFVAHVDDLIQAALHTAVARAIKCLYAALQPPKHQQTPPVLITHVTLHPFTPPCIALQPSLDDVSAMLHQVCQCIYTAPHVLHRLGFRDEDEESVAAAVAAVRSGLQQSTESGKTAPMHDGGGGAHGGGGGGSNAAAGAAGGSTALDASSLPFTVSLSQSTSSKLSLLAPTTHATAAAVAPHHHAFAKLLVMSEHYTIPHNTTTHNTTTHNTMTQQPTHHEGSRNQSDTAGIGAIGIGATATGASVTGTPPLSMASETAGPQQVPSHAVVGVIQGLQEGVEEHVRALEGVYHSVWDVDKEAYLRRYQRANKTAAAVDADIARHSALGEQMLREEPLVQQGPLLLDITPLKQAVVEQCEAWASSLMDMLHASATKELHALHQLVTASTHAVRGAAAEHSAADGHEVHGVQTMIVGDVETLVSAVQDKYRVLQSHEAEVSMEELRMLQELPALWRAYTAQLGSGTSS